MTEGGELHTRPEAKMRRHSIAQRYSGKLVFQLSRKGLESAASG